MNTGEHIIISGTGRCGTTFLMMIYSYLNQGTNFPTDPDRLKRFIDKHSGSGLELLNVEVTKERVVKAPAYLIGLKSKIDSNPWLKDRIKYVIIPIRDYEKCAESRVNLGDHPLGGIDFNRVNLSSEITDMIGKKALQDWNHKDMLATYLKTMVEYDLDTIFLDFDRMVSSPKYLWDKINSSFINDITYDQFLVAWEIANNHQKDKSQRNVKI